MTGEESDAIFREVDVMKTIKSKYVVDFLGNYFYKNAIWIAMELCDRGSVESLIVKLKTLSEPQMAPIVKSVFGGLAYS
jgi:serine/threonine protein kinase